MHRLAILICLLMVSSSTAYSVEIDLPQEHSINYFKISTLTLEHAKKSKEISWGLMGRDYLPENHGMILHMKNPSKIRIWMFNCLIDLSVAFLDDNHKILSLHELKAYPNKMDPRRPIFSLEDIDRLYPNSDPIVRFFLSKEIVSPPGTKYVLEMNKKWFQKNKVKVGDLVVWKENEPQAYILRVK